LIHYIADSKNEEMRKSIIWR